MLESKHLPREMKIPLTQKGGRNNQFILQPPNRWIGWREVYAYIRPGKRIRVNLTVVRSVGTVFGLIKYTDANGNQRKQTLNPEIPIVLDLGKPKRGGPAKKWVKVNLKTTWIPILTHPWNNAVVNVIVTELN